MYASLATRCILNLVNYTAVLVVSVKIDNMCSLCTDPDSYSAISCFDDKQKIPDTASFHQLLSAEFLKRAAIQLDWLQSLKRFFINVSYHILVASLTLMALF